MRIKLELVIHKNIPDIVYLNYWDAMHGNDVCVSIDQQGNFLINEQIVTINEWLEVLRGAINET